MPEVEWDEEIRTLPLVDAMERVNGPKGIWAEYLARKPADPAWFRGGLWHDDEGFGVPSLWLFSWYDISTGPNLALANHVIRNGNDEEVREGQFVVVAPVEHCAFFRADSPYTIGERELGDIDFDYEKAIFDFFGERLAGEPTGFSERTPTVRYFAFGVNEWREADGWPPAGVERVPLYLSSEGQANSLFGDGRLVGEAPERDRPDRFTYDPTVPVPSLGGGICCIGGTIEPGAFDQRPLEARADVLVYTGEPLERDLDVTGPVEVTLWVSSDAPDTDFTVKLIDVLPDGTAYNVDETIQRVRYREGYEREVFMKPGEVYRLAVSPMTVSNVFLAGHRVRIEVSSSNFPRFSRNLNTGGSNYDESEPRIARNAVHHSKRYPSRIVLSVLR